ncbi:YbaK/EbsC family protein [Longispora sp. K20-0274]|uniref:YbaK/EbsC family protein n=1 Tax=Longispora sp. K20-0274 TaxID=3088255 RepID=UPI0039998669
MSTETPHATLLALLDGHGARYRLIDHEPEGRTDVVSAIRGNALAQAAKCIILRVKTGKKTSRHLLVVVPGDRRVDLGAAKALVDGTYASFTDAAAAEALTGCASGTILPFSFHEDLELVVDPDLLGHEELYFNAARLEQSMVLNTEDYVAVAKPRIEKVAEPAA